jgi:hypothetical protein
VNFGFLSKKSFSTSKKVLTSTESRPDAPVNHGSHLTHFAISNAQGATLGSDWRSRSVIFPCGGKATMIRHPQECLLP